MSGKWSADVNRCCQAAKKQSPLQRQGALCFGRSITRQLVVNHDAGNGIGNLLASRRGDLGAVDIELTQKALLKLLEHDLEQFIVIQMNIGRETRCEAFSGHFV